MNCMELNVIMVSHAVELTPYVKTIGTQCFNAEVFDDYIATTLKDNFFHVNLCPFFSKLTHTAKSLIAIGVEL